MKKKQAWLVVVVICVVGLMGVGVVSGAEEGAAAAVGGEKPKTFIQVVKQGGIMMIPLGLTSVMLLTLVIDAFMRLRNAKLAPPELVEQLRSQFRAGDYNGAFQTCKARPSFLTNVVRVGLGMLGHGRATAERSMEDALSKEVSVLSTRIRYMSVIGVVTPMLGLTGTVLGMIHAFSTIGNSGIGDPTALAGAIGEVLVATFTGLAVAIPGFAFYYFFGNRITATTAYAEDVINGLFRGMPYDQLSGVEIGDEPIYAGPPAASLLKSKRATESTQNVIACPTCQNSVTVGSPACPSCQTPLQWAA